MARLDRHRLAVDALLAAAPSRARDRLRSELIEPARAASVPWIKILAALAMAAAGGFTPAAIAAALAMLFGGQQQPTPTA